MRQKGEAVDLVDLSDLQHTLVRAREHDLIVLFVSPEITNHHMNSLEHFADAISDETEATLAILPANVVTDCRNYTLHELLDLRSMVDDLITARVGSLPDIDA